MRNKSSNPESLYKVATDLLSDKIIVYLPQKHTVLLQWLFDYFSEKRSNPAKVQTGFWQIFADLWKHLIQSSDQDTLSRLYLSHNFVAILNDTFDEISAKIKQNTFSFKQTSELLLSITTAIETVNQSNLWFKLPVDTASQFIKIYTNLIITIFSKFEDAGTSYSTLDNLTVYVRKILNSTISSSSDLKKLSTSFNSKLLGPIFIVFGYDLPYSTSKLYEDLVSLLLVLPGESNEKVEEKKGLISKTLNSSVSEEGISDSHIIKSSSKLFNIVVKSSPQNATVFFSILQSLSSSSLKSMIEIASRNTVKLESSVLESIFSQIFSSKAIDWELLKYIHTIDESFLTTDENLRKILAVKQNKNTSKAHFEEFSELYITYFANSRELPNFILSWKSYLKESCWDSEFVAKFLSAQIKTLSNIQLKSLLNILVKHILVADNAQDSPKQLLLPVIVCVLSFFQQRTLPNPMIYQPLFDILETEKMAESFYFWTLKYLILSISPGFVEKYGSQIWKQAENIKYGLKFKDNNTNNIAFNVMQTLFRVEEIKKINEFNSYCSKLIKYISDKATPSEQEQIFNSICDRWLLLVNDRFKEKHKTKLIGLISLDESSFEKLATNDLFFEQKAISPTVIDQLGTLDTSKPISDSTEFLRVKIISTIPLEVVKAAQRKETLDKLVTKALLESSKQSLNFEHHLTICKAINHLLNFPSSATEIASDPKVFEKYFESSNLFDDLAFKQSINEGCEKVIQYHISLSKGGSGKVDEFLENLIERQVKHLKSSKKSTNLDLSTLLLSLIPSSLLKDNQISILLVDKIKEYLVVFDSKVEKQTDNLEKVLHAIKNLALLVKSQQYFREMLTEISDLYKISGSQASFFVKKINELEDEKSTEAMIYKSLAKYCFTIISYLSNTAEQLISCVALYITLADINVDVSDDDLIICLSRADEPNLVLYLNYFVSSFDSEKISFYSSYIKAFECSIRACKDAENEVISRYVTLFLKKILHITKSMGENDLKQYLKLAEYLAKERSKLFTQFSFDLLLSTIVQICSPQDGPSFSSKSPEEIYSLITSVSSSIVVFNRSRFNGRYHIHTQLLTSLLRCLTKQSSIVTNEFSSADKSSHLPAWINSKTSGHMLSTTAASSFTRLISNITSTIINHHGNSERNDKYQLSSYSQILKKQLSIQIGVVLLNYIRFSLKEGFTPDVRQGLAPSIYMIFDTIGPEQLKNVNLLLDSNSRPYFKTLYNDYITHGKWKGD